MLSILPITSSGVHRPAHPPGVPLTKSLICARVFIPTSMHIIPALLSENRIATCAAALPYVMVDNFDFSAAWCKHLNRFGSCFYRLPQIFPGIACRSLIYLTVYQAILDNRYRCLGFTGPKDPRHRRTGLSAYRQVRRRFALLDLQSALRARLHRRHHQPRIQELARGLQQSQHPHLRVARSPTASRRNRHHRGQELPHQRPDRVLISRLNLRARLPQTAPLCATNSKPANSFEIHADAGTNCSVVRSLVLLALYGERPQFRISLLCPVSQILINSIDLC